MKTITFTKKGFSSPLKAREALEDLKNSLRYKYDGVKVLNAYVRIKEGWLFQKDTWYYSLTIKRRTYRGES